MPHADHHRTAEPAIDATPRRSSFAPVVRGAVVPGLLVVIVVMVIGALGIRRADASSCSESVPAGSIRVVVVVDPGSGGSPSSACLVAPAGTTGSQALARRAAELGMPAPRYNGSGLLCAIDGAPAAPACGDRNAGGFAYWAYFDGTAGSWVYGNFNPFVRRLNEGAIEGWRFVDGAGNGSDPPPRIAPSRSLFPAVVTPTTMAPTAPAGGGGATGGSSGGGGAAGDAGASSPVTIDAASPSSTTVASSADVVELAATPVGSQSSSSSLVPVVIVVVVIALLGAGAVVRARRRA